MAVGHLVYLVFEGSVFHITFFVCTIVCWLMVGWNVTVRGDCNHTRVSGVGLGQ